MIIQSVQKIMNFKENLVTIFVTVRFKSLITGFILILIVTFSAGQKYHTKCQSEESSTIYLCNEDIPETLERIFFVSLRIWEGDFLEALEALGTGKGKEFIDKTSNSNKETLLHLATKEGNKDTVLKLLDRSTDDVNARDKDGKTALYMAAEKDHADTVQALLNHGAYVNARDDNYGETALHVAAEKDHAETVQVLLNHDADADVNARDKDDWTALHWAAYKDNTKTVQVLLNHDADVNARDKDDWTALHWAAYKDNTKTVQVLLMKNNTEVNAQDKDGKTALDLATDRGHTKIIQLLKEHGARHPVAQRDASPQHRSPKSSITATLATAII